MSADLGDFYRKTRAARKIIVVDLGFLGDSVQLMPALRELKQNYPAAELHVLTTPLGAEMLALAPCVDRSWALELAPGRRTWREQWRLVRGLRRQRYDAAFNFSGADRTVIMTALCGARWRVSHVGGRWHFWNAWLIPHWIPRQPATGPVFERRRQMLALCGLELGEARYDLQIPEEDRRWADAQVADGSVHFSINASSHLKEWPVEKWIALGRRLGDECAGLRIVATAGRSPREQRRLETFAAALSALPAVQVFSGLPLARLAALLTRCRLHVGADSGVLHLAVALGKPTVSLFRESAGVRGWLPDGAAHRVLMVSCPCTGQRRADCLNRPEAACLAAIETATVAALVLEQLSAHATGKVANS
jgi:ADP-heptose:LPS heptosyltransferase